MSEWTHRHKVLLLGIIHGQPLSSTPALSVYWSLMAFSAKLAKTHTCILYVGPRR